MAHRFSVTLVAFAFGVLSACSERRAAVPVDVVAGPRLVALAPHLAELVFAAGAGDALIAVSEYSDRPAAVKSLPIVGDAFAVDMERMALLEPDIVIAWHSGTPAKTVADLRAQGYRVETLRTESLADVAAALLEIGEIAGTEDVAYAAASRFLEAIEMLRREYANEDSIRVFYQVSARPLYTVNGSHFISELISLCGGENVFRDLNRLAPTVSVEAVLLRDPEVLIAGRANEGGSVLADWDRWPELAANRYENSYLIPADLISRATPRLAHAGALLCERLETARRNRMRAAGGA